MTQTSNHTEQQARVPKILGADVELGNFVEGIDTKNGTGRTAARLLLRETGGVPADGGSPPATWGTYAGASHDERVGRAQPLPEGDPQDWGRRFLPSNAGSIYVDLDHLELAQSETRSAFDFVAHARAMLSIAGEALDRANRRMPAGCRVVALANCSDGLDHSYGAHVNVLVSRAAWENICVRKPHYLAYLAAFQTSSIVYTGAGKVGSENGRPDVAYQISQRADFVETLVGDQTTYRRPIVNARDEPLCGPRSWRPSQAGADLARLHVIFYDHTLAQVGTLLKGGTLQIIGAMLEAGAVNAALALDDPLEALIAWSHDPGLTARARTVGGEGVSAVELQFRFLGEAKRFAHAGGLDDIVPRAAEILTLWEDTLVKLRARDWAALARRLDWVLKHQILHRAMARRRSLEWTSPELKHLDQVYASLDPREGLFWAHERDGLLDRVVTDEAIAHAVQEPPDDTRAWTRAHLLRLAGEDGIDRVDWDSVCIKLPREGGSGHWLPRRTIDLPHPARATAAEHGALFDGEPDLDRIATALAREEEPGGLALWTPGAAYPVARAARPENA
jgi:proteasome accessory factor A